MDPFQHVPNTVPGGLGVLHGTHDELELINLYHLEIFSQNFDALTDVLLILDEVLGSKFLILDFKVEAPGIVVFCVDSPWSPDVLHGF